MRLRSLLCVSVLLCSPTLLRAQAAATWLCISDKSTGFTNESGLGWRAANFKAGKRYLIKKSTLKDVAWEVRVFGDQGGLPEAWCSSDFTSLKVLTCRGMFTEFDFNGEAGRFLKTYTGGYWTYHPGNAFFGKDTGDTPVIEIGTCSPL